MIVREQVDKKHKLHPKSKEVWNRMTQPPKPLEFKLHSMEDIRKNQKYVTPTQVFSLNTQEGEPAATYDMFEQYKNFHVNVPLGNLDPLPFRVERTHK